MIRKHWEKQEKFRPDFLVWLLWDQLRYYESSGSKNKIWKPWF